MSLDSACWISDLTKIKLHLHIGLSDSAKDSFLEQLANAAYKILEKYIGYPVKSATYTEYYSGDATGILMLDKWPVISITSVYVDPLRLWTSDTLVDAGDYYFNPETGIIEFFQHLGTGPGWFDSGVRNIRVIYVAGYVTAPNDLIEALIEYIAYLFVQSGTEGFTSQSMGSRTEAYDAARIPERIRWKLMPYKNRQV